MKQVNSAYLTTPQYSWQLCVAGYFLMRVLHARVDWSLASEDGREGALLHMNECYSFYLKSFEKEAFIHGKWLYCDWPALIHSAKIVIRLVLVYNVCFLIWYILCLCRADPEEALQQQHGRTPFPIAISSWICGVTASKQQGDPTFRQKQRACTTGNWLIPPSHYIHTCIAKANNSSI